MVSGRKSKDSVLLPFVKMKKGAGNGYDAPTMVEKHYEPHREGELLGGERVDITSLAAAYKLDRKGLRALADYMNDIIEKMEGKIAHVPSKADEIARKHATIELPKPQRRNGPSPHFWDCP